MQPVPRILTLGVVLAVGSLAPAAAEGPAVEPRAAFERLKTLAGTWEGQAAGEKGAVPATTVYRVASGGSVVQETLAPGTPHEMISMYHLAGGQLVMTHYCAIGNQPRMKLDAAASGPDRLVFAFDGGTNFDPAKDTHIHAGVIEWKGEALQSDWAVWKDGKESAHHRFRLERKK